jgi:hypothetical protein
METLTVENNIQQYIERLKRELKHAEQRWENLKQYENQATKSYQYKSDFSGFLGVLLDLLSATSALGVGYIHTLSRASALSEKAGMNARRGVWSMRIMIGEARKNMDCMEVLTKLIKDLGDRINCKIPVKDEAKSVMTIIRQLKEEAEKAIVTIRDMVLALLKTLQLQEDLRMRLVGKRGLVYHLNAMRRLAEYGNKNDPGDTDDPEDMADCSSCKPKTIPIFPMDDPRCDFYTKLHNEYKGESGQLPGLKDTMDTAIAKRERAEAKKDSLSAALKAAQEAKCCDKK